MHHHNAKLMDCDYSKLFYAKREFELLIAFLFSVLKPLLSIIVKYIYLHVDIHYISRNCLITLRTYIVD